MEPFLWVFVFFPHLFFCFSFFPFLFAFVRGILCIPRFHLQIGCLSSSSRIDDTKRNIVTLPCHSLPHFRDNKQCNGKNKYGFCVIMYLIQSVSNNSKVRCFWEFLSILIFRQRVQILLSPDELKSNLPSLIDVFLVSSTFHIFIWPTRNVKIIIRVDFSDFFTFLISSLFYAHPRYIS